MNQSRLKWLLVILLVLALSVTAWSAVHMTRDKGSSEEKQTVVSTDVVANQPPEEVTRTLEALKAPNDTENPSEENINRQLGQLKTHGDPPELSGENIRKQIEALHNQ